ncbi:MAG TPA: M23 family peptidase, partial [Methylotenera sp.]|nr:M23 family peptidase [Methylotenera sp.]
MNIILVSNKMAKAKSLSVMQAGMLVTALVLVPVLLTLLFITPQSNIKEQGVKALLPPHLKSSIISSQVHLDAYAKELGELQARRMRLDAQSERLAKIAGEKGKPSGKKSSQTTDSLLPANRGGPLVNAHPMTEPDLQAAILELTKAV